jgi:hypothetical protein
VAIQNLVQDRCGHDDRVCLGAKVATSKRVGRMAGKLLSTSKSKAVKAVAASALRQERKVKPKSKK